MAEKNSTRDTKDLDIKNLNVVLMNFFNRFYLVISVLVFVVIAGVIFLGIIPTIQDISKVRKDLTKNNAEAIKLEEKIKALQKATDETFEKNAAELNQVLYSRKPFLELLYGVSLAAAEHQVVFDKFEFSPGFVATEAAAISGVQRDVAALARNDAAKKDQFIVLELEVRSGLENIVGFMHTLEQTAPATNISYSEISQNTTSGITRGKIEALIYYYNRDVSTTVDSTLPTIKGEAQITLDGLSDFVQPDLSDLDQMGVSGGGKENLFLPYGSFGSEDAIIFGE